VVAILAAMVCVLGVASIGGSSTRSNGAGVEKPSAAVTSPAAAGVGIHYADADRDILDLQLD
jgi:hypothetical protein